MGIRGLKNDFKLDFLEIAQCHTIHLRITSLFINKIVCAPDNLFFVLIIFLSSKYDTITANSSNFFGPKIFNRNFLLI